MMIRIIVLTACLFIPLLQGAERPNFVVIFIDDMGYGDIEPFGSKVNRTPQLNRMAEEGMKLTSFYAAPVCSASRAQLMTGSYAPRVSVPGVFFPAGSKGLNPAEHTVADYLKELGYATACVGKWHLGDQIQFLPTRNGFDTYFGIPYSNDMQRVDLASGKRVHPLLRNETVIELLEDEDQRRVTREYTLESIKFIEENAKANNPFFLYLPHTAMHVPLFPHRNFVGKSRNGIYGDWVAEVDWSVGQILMTLEDLEIDDNTLVLFTSDNGPWASKGKNGGVAGPLRGSKGGTLEGGVRVPTIAWWPGKIEPGSESDAIAGTTDVLPTFVSLAGGKLKNDVVIDGFDLSQVLLGKADQTEREAWYYFSGTKLQAVRSGPWKLAVTAQRKGMGFKETAVDIKKPGRLYNLDQEIGEKTSVAAKYPDIVTRLQRLATAKSNEIARNTRPPGIAKSPVTLYPSASRIPKIKIPKVSPFKLGRAKNGNTYPPESVPNVSHQYFNLSCKIDSAEPEGVVIAHGGSAVGYSLYIKDGRAVFALRNGSGETGITRVSTKIEQTGNFTLAGGLTTDGIYIFSTLSKTAQEEVEGQLRSHPVEDLCIGHDNKNPLDPRAPKGMFNGTISEVSIDTHESEAIPINF